MSRDTAGAPLRLLAVHAHPDDESSKGAATMAKYVMDGAEVLVVTCTGGELGSVLNPSVDGSVTDLAVVRQAEMEEARAILGVEQRWLGYRDSGMPADHVPAPGSFAAQPVDVPAEKLVEIIREFKPHAMVTYDEKGGYAHLDHEMTHKVSVAAFEAAGDPDAFPEAGPPWQPLKLYYQRPFTRDVVRHVHEALLADGRESPYGPLLRAWERERSGQSIPDSDSETAADAVLADDPTRRVTTRVHVAEYHDVADRALKAHRTQVHEHSQWFSLPTDVRREALPTEDYELARSLVPSALPEDDLFAGVRPALATDGTTRGLYAELGVAPSATHEEIDAAWRRVARLLRVERATTPDRVARFVRAQLAWDILGDPERRRAYDASRSARRSEQATRARPSTLDQRFGGPGAGHPRSMPSRRRGRQVA